MHDSRKDPWDVFLYLAEHSNVVQTVWKKSQCSRTISTLVDCIEALIVENKRLRFCSNERIPRVQLAAKSEVHSLVADLAKALRDKRILELEEGDE